MVAYAQYEASVELTIVEFTEKKGQKKDANGHTKHTITFTCLRTL